MQNDLIFSTNKIHGKIFIFGRKFSISKTKPSFVVNIPNESQSKIYAVKCYNPSSPSIIDLMRIT